MKPYIRLVRPKQWTKNLLVFAAPLFTNAFASRTVVLHSAMAFAAMCCMSSFVYVFNDWRDAEKDRAHPVKKHRPIAAGLIKPGAAAAIALGLFAVGGSLLYLLGPQSIEVVAAYFVLQLLYNAGAKAIPVLDVFLIATGFVLRAVLGAAAINVLISPWLLLCTNALALLLGFAKRRHEYILQGENRGTSRLSLRGYSRQALDAFVMICATAAVLCYGLYALQSQTARRFPALYITTPFVFYGICRYVLIVFVSDEGGEPEHILLKDKHILASIILFVIAAAVAVSGARIPLIEVARGGMP